MEKNENIWILTKLREECEKVHLDSEAKALAAAVYSIGIVEEMKQQRDAALAMIDRTYSNMAEDAISRQAEVNAIAMRIGAPARDWVDVAESWLANMPSAQPEAHDSQKEVAKYVTAFSTGYDRGKADAQPEIIRCKDCKHYTHMWYCEAWNNSPGFPAVSDDMFCSLAESREDKSNDGLVSI